MNNWKCTNCGEQVERSFHLCAGSHLGRFLAIKLKHIKQILNEMDANECRPVLLAEKQAIEEFMGIKADDRGDV